MYSKITAHCDKKVESGAKGIGRITDTTMKRLYGYNPAKGRKR